MPVSPLDLQLENYLNKSIDKYLDESKMIKDSVWATDADILATAFVLQADIVVFANHRFNKEWLRFCTSLIISNETEDAI